jgi:signal peptidase I
MPEGRRLSAALAEWIGTVIVLALAIRTFFILPARVPTPSMAPTLMPGQWILIERCRVNFLPPQLGDCVVLDAAALGDPSRLSLEPADFFVKRLAGLPGDHVRLRNNRRLEVNGLEAAAANPRIAAHEESPEFPGTWEFRGFLNQEQVHALGGATGVAPWFPDERSEVRIGRSQVLVLGDNSLESLDSRAWGPIPARAVIGRVVKW